MHWFRWACLVLVLAGGIGSLAGCCCCGTLGGEGVSDGIFVHISQGPDDPHRVLMGLAMASIMHEAGRDVLVYFDIKGIEVVLKDSADLTYEHFASSRTQIAKLIDGGATVCACPGCLKAAGKGPEDLMPGVHVADKDRFYSFTKGRILTIDY
jgi:predicted peroxiredoxin